VPSAQSIPHAARELGYIAVGFSVLGFQRLQVRRRELERAAAPALRALTDALGDIGQRAGIQVPCASRRSDRQAQ
jgi:hypothetical protein